MFRPVESARSLYEHGDRFQESWPRLVVPLIIWICVSIIIRNGYFGDTQMVLGPGASRLMRASSVFVRHVEAIDDDKKGILLYRFSEKPELSLETKWSTQNHMNVEAFSHKGFALWLNKGSRIHLRWEARSSFFDQIQVAMIKGERKHETLPPDSTASLTALNYNESINGKEAHYIIDEDDKYYIRFTNANARSIIMTMSMNVTSKIHDLSKSTNMCSTINGSCKLKLPFPKTQYIVLTTPNNVGPLILFQPVMIVIFVISFQRIEPRCMPFALLQGDLHGCNPVEVASRQVDEDDGNTSETQPIIQEKPMTLNYGTNREDDDDGASSSSSEDLYDAKLCVICYDEQRNCFFVPCGHCATCYDCAQRIMEGETKVCPICRRLIHKVRRLFSP